MRVSYTFLTVDAVVFKTINNKLYLLLIKRKNEPFQNAWALPVGFVDENEDIDVAVKRELLEETQIEIDELTQLKAFGKPFRDPRCHVVSVAYYGFVAENVVAIASDDAKEAKWFSVNDLPNLAFDHDEIINFALQKTAIK
ncbi:NUDIX domain-containing protein [Flavobacterium phycosphaerae]|uniref:NUDIX domain-containing protein n=1 Tax=Flavobacterium phycosphaerae TaxID=2697515 RepID=UPI00138AE9DA|nr:NUDIX hydrolase [Flavobacterium phycosphaerae]